MNCPVCESKAEISCKCPRGDSECVNGHKYHYCLVHERRVTGDADHKIPDNICSCPPSRAEVKPQIWRCATCGTGPTMDADLRMVRFAIPSQFDKDYPLCAACRTDVAEMLRNFVGSDLATPKPKPSERNLIL